MYHRCVFRSGVPGVEQEIPRHPMDVSIVTVNVWSSRMKLEEMKLRGSLPYPIRRELSLLGVCLLTRAERKFQVCVSSDSEVDDIGSQWLG